MSDKIIITILDSMEHIAGAIVLGKSIKKNGNNIMVSIIVPFEKDEKINTLLMQFYDNIIYKNMTINDLKDLKYSKILYIDINSVINKLLFDIFKLDEQFNIDDKFIYLIPKLNSNEFVKNNMFGIDINENINDYYGIQYTKIIPFIIKNKIPIENRVNLICLNLWFYYYRDILNNNFDLYSNPFLENANLTIKYFLNPLANKNVLISNKFKCNKAKIIKKIFGIETNKNMNYYYFDMSNDYNNEKINYTNKKMEKINGKSNNKLTDEDVSCLSRQYDNTSIIFLVDMEKHNYENIFYKKKYNLKGYELKNILFNTYKIFVYKERIKFLNKLYDDDKEYKLNVLFYKSIENIGLELNPKKNIYVFSKVNQKISATSIILNENSMKNIANGSINFIKKDSLLNLKFQTLKKWIYVNYDGNTINNLIVNNIDFVNTTIIDTNEHDIFDVKRLNDKKIPFIDIIFSKNNYYKEIIKKYEMYINNVNNIDKYYEIDGIKIHI